jgi:transposase
MSRRFTEEELDKLDKKALVMLFMSLQDQLQQMNDTLNRLTEQIAAANQYRFGRHSEKLDNVDGQLTIFDLLNEAEYTVQEADDLHEPEADDVIITYRRKKTKGKRDVDLKDLPVVEIPHELSDEKLHELFGDKWKTLPDEVYKRLAYEPGRYVVHEHHVKVYAGKDNQTIIRADRPKDLLRNSIVTPSLEAGIMNAKYVNAVPLYRQEQELKRNGISISRQVMANWTIQCADRYLAVMYDWLHKQIYNYHVLQADETPVIVTKDGRHAGAKSYMWVYRTGMMYRDQPIILYEYQKERKADHPREFLKAFSGVVVTDGYEVYHKLARERQDLKISGCWSHARRRFSEAVKAAGKTAGKNTLAYIALQKIARIYQADNSLADLSPEERLKKRQTLVRPLVEDYFAWVKEVRPQIAGGSKTAKGFDYCLKQEPYLRYFLEDGEVPIDNNAAEQAIRPFCVGKKNWLMIDTIAGARSSAIIYSIAETAKANNLNPFRYFELLLTRIPEHLEDTDRSFLRKLEPWSQDLPAECRKQLK